MGWRAVFPILLLLGACASGAGMYRAGQQAYASGQLEEARTAYEEALRAEPNNAQYRRALEGVTRELVTSFEEQAIASERRQDWLAASQGWAKAAELTPGSEEFALRRDLSLLKSQNLDPDAWYRGVREVAARHPEHEILRRTFEKAKKQAYLFQLGLAKREIGLRHHQKAVAHIQRAIEIDPEHPGLSQSEVARTRALALVEEGDELLGASNPVAALDRYQAAYELTPSASIKRKLDRTRSHARELLAMLDSARKSAAKGSYAKAIKLYARLVKMKGAPQEAVRELADLEQRIITEIAGAAKDALSKNDLRAAHRHLARGLEQAKADRPTRRAAKAGLARIERGEPASGLEAIVAAKLPPEGAPLLVAIKSYALAVAKKRIGDVEELAKRDMAAAQRLLEELDPFRDELPDVKRLERALKVESFIAELDRAKDAARRGNDRGAAELLLKALATSQAPKEIREPIRDACEQLAKQKYAEAERLFSVVRERAPRSRLANTGVAIAQMRRAELEQRALAALEKGNGRELEAVAVLESSVGIRPESPYLQKGRETLLSRLSQEVSDQRAAELIELAARLSKLTPSARAALLEGAKHLGSGAYGSSERAFAIALERAPEAKVATAGIEFTSARRQVEASRAESAKRAATEAIRKRIAEADERARRKDWAGALSMYQAIEREAGSAALDAKIAAAEAGLIEAVLERADRASSRSQRDAARKELGEALDRMRATPESARARAKIGLDRIIAGEPGEGLHLVRSAGVRSEPFLASAERFAEMVARSQIEEAKRAAEKDPGRAAEILRDLQPFEVRLPEIAELRRRLKVDAFTAKLERAQLAADAGNKGEASRVLKEVLGGTRAPPALKRAVLAGCAALEREQWIDAERAFMAALESAKESRIADYALDVARTFRRRAEERALETIRKDGEGVDEAVELLASFREIAPQDPLRAEAEKLLTSRLTRSRRLSNEEAAALIARVGALSGANEVVRGAEALKAGDHPGAAAAFGAALAKDPSLKIAKIGLERSQASLVEGVASGAVPVESEATALVLRGLLEKQPSDPDLLASLEKLVGRVKAASEPETVARHLTLAAIASGMEGPLRESVDAGASALAKGDLDAAGKALTRAIEIDPSSEVARAGLEAAEEAKKSNVVKRIVAEHDAGREDRVKSELARKLEDGTTFLQLMLAEATRLASLGRDGDAAKILDAANAVTEGPAKGGVKRGNALLASGRHQEAEKAYAAHSENAEVAEAGEKIAFTRHIQKLLDGVRALGRLEDLESSAKAAAEIFAIDPRDSDVKRALEKVYQHAETSAEAKDRTEVLRTLRAAAAVIGRTEELAGALRAIKAAKDEEASEMLRKLGVEFAEESEEEETAARTPVVEFTKRARAALGKL